MKKKDSIECWIYQKKKNCFLLLQCPETHRHRSYWQPITGGVEKNETPVQTCIREVVEETGLLIKSDKIITLIEQLIVFVEDENYELNKTVFIFNHSEPDSKILISDEHINYKWMSPEKVPDFLLWESNKKTFSEVIKYLGIKGSKNC